MAFVRAVVVVVVASVAFTLGSLDCRVAAAQEDEVSATDFTWRTAGGQYIDPTAFFSLHGYVDGVYAVPGDDWRKPDPSQLGPPGQLLIPATADNSFGFDAALFFAADPTPSTHLLMELHLVTDPSGTGAAGPGGLTIALTEATAAWDIAPDYLTLSAGLFWAPFATINQDWLSAQGMFGVVPRAAGAFPIHWNERGVRLNGSIAITPGFGFNYVASVGNGVRTFDLRGQEGFDGNGDKTVMGRVGVFPGLGSELDVGISGAYGRLRSSSEATEAREGTDPAAARSADQFPGELVATAVDITYDDGARRLRSYAVWSQERLARLVASESAPGNIERLGAVLELGWDFPVDLGPLAAVAPKARADFIQRELLRGPDSADAPDNAVTAGFGVGLTLYPSEQLIGLDRYPYRNVYLSFEWHTFTELEGDGLDNDVFASRFIAKF